MPAPPSFLKQALGARTVRTSPSLDLPPPPPIRVLPVTGNARSIFDHVRMLRLLSRASGRWPPKPIAYMLKMGKQSFLILETQKLQIRNLPDFGTFKVLNSGIWVKC